MLSERKKDQTAEPLAINKPGNDGERLIGKSPLINWANETIKHYTVVYEGFYHQI